MFWTLIKSKMRFEKLNFSIGWLSNVKNLVLSNGCKHVRNVIQCKQNASGKTPQTSITCQSKRGEDQLDDLELDGPITLRILDGIDWDFAQAK